MNPRYSLTGYENKNFIERQDNLGFNVSWNAANIIFTNNNKASQ